MYWVLTPMYEASRTTPVRWLCPAGASVAVLVQPDLLGADADVHGRRGRRRASAGTWTDGPVAELDDAEPVGRRPGTRRRSRLLTPRKPGDEPRRRPLVERLGVAQLLVAAVVHHGDAVGHRHRLLLVVGHVDERDPDLLLDALELDLHLLAQLEVEGAERLVEEEDGGPVDERPRERDALRLAARDLGRLALLEARQLDELEHVA